MRKRWKKGLSRYINCSFRGAISLFMAVLMTPFLSIAMILVETGRYNSAVSILEEAMGISSTSTLANYDRYLHDRWGLMAVDQGIKINDEYKKLLLENEGILGESLSLDRVSADGIYDLADSEILYQQLMEYCKLNSPTTLAMNFGNLSDLLKSINKYCNNIGSIFSMVTSGVDTLDSTITLVESVDKLKKVSRELDELKSKYDSKYTDFKEAVNDLISILEEPEPEISDYKKTRENEEDDRTEETEEAYDMDAYNKAVEKREKRIKAAKTRVNSAKSPYIEVISDIIKKQEEFKEMMEDCSEAINNIKKDLADVTATAIDYKNYISGTSKDLEALQKDIKNLEKSSEFNPASETYLNMKDMEQALSEKVASQSMKGGIANATKAGVTTVVNGYKKTFGDYSDAVLGEYIKGFKQLKEKVERFNVESITKNSWAISDADYHNIAVAGYIAESDIDAYMKEQEKELVTGRLKGLVDGLAAFMDSIMNLSVFYNPDFSATIDMNYYNTQFGSLPGGAASGGGVMAVVNDIGSFLSSVKSFKENLGRLKLINALKSIRNMIISVQNLLIHIAQFGMDIVTNIAELFSSSDRLFYSAYTTFNLPCRTDYSNRAVSFKTMTGYSLGPGSLADKGTGAANIFGNLQVLIQSIQTYAESSGTDLTFSGAELEYILYGSKSEVSNQLYTFCTLYLIRLILDAVPVLSNVEVQALATASTFGYPIVMAIEILLEPLADTVLLVNGANLDILKSVVYLTPSGLPNLLSGLVSFVKVTADQKESLKSGLVNAFGAADENYDYQHTLATAGETPTQNNPPSGNKVWNDYKPSFFKLNYREYCFLLLLLTVTKEQQMARIQNLIQMETLYHYKTSGASYTFDLRKSYTYLKTEADVSVKQMLPSLLDSSLFSIKREQYRGY